jgi:hypothetical protein
MEEAKFNPNAWTPGTRIIVVEPPFSDPRSIDYFRELGVDSTNGFKPLDDPPF